MEKTIRKTVIELIVALLLIGMFAEMPLAVEASEPNFYLVTPSHYLGDHVGETFQVNVNVTVAGHGGHGMFGYAFKFYWNRTLINATGCTVYRPADWGSSWIDVGSGLTWDYNTTHGQYETATTALSPAPEVYGNFTLVTIDFEVIHQPVYPQPDGYCLLNLADALLAGQAGYKIPVDVYDGTYEIESFVEIHDVAVTNIHTACYSNYSAPYYKTVVCKNYTVCVNVTVANEGNFTETTNVALWVESLSTTYQIETAVPVTFESGTSKEFTFVLDSTDLPIGFYVMFANATVVTNETETGDNTFLGSWIYIAHPGDLDMDNHVHLYDLTIVGTAWDSRPGDPYWWANADIDGNCHVFLYDLTILGDHWDEYAP
jgi:hypothetical protein